MERVLLCKPYPLLALLYVRGKGVNRYINTHIRDFEERIGAYLATEYGFARYEKEDLVLANYYPQEPVTDSMRTMLLANPDATKSIWNEIFFWC